MKILCMAEVTPYENVAHAGGKVFYNHLLRLSKYADIDLVCYCDSGEEVHKKELEHICNNVELVNRGSLKDKPFLNILFQIKKFSIALFNRDISLGYPVNINKYVKKIKDMLKENNYDLVELSFTSSLTYLPIIRKIKPDIKINIIEHDVSFLNIERSYEYKTKKIDKMIALLRLKVYKSSEIKLLHKCNMITVLNDKDRKILLKYGFSDNSIFTETPYFQKPELSLDYILKYKKVKNSIMFYGALWRKENDESIYNFLVKVFPKILKKNKDIKLYIVGNKPTKRVIEFNDNKNVFVTGFVEDPSKYFLQSEVFIAPLLLGAGIKIKVLEALSYALPVISTTVGIEGIDADKEGACIREDDIEKFSSHIDELFDDDDLRISMSKKAFNFIQKKYDIDSSVKKLYERYKML